MIDEVGERRALRAARELVEGGLGAAPLQSERWYTRSDFLWQEDRASLPRTCSVAGCDADAIVWTSPWTTRPPFAACPGHDAARRFIRHRD